MVIFRHVADLHLAVVDHRHQSYLLMNGALPPERPQSFKKFGPQFPVKIVDRPKRKLVRVIHLHDINLRQQRLLQPPERLSVLPVQHLIRIGRIDIFHLCFGKGKITRRCKVPDPGEIIEPVRVAGGNLFRIVRGAGVHDDDLVHQVRNAVQAPCQNLFFIFHDHAQTDCDHFTLLLPSASKPPHSFYNDSPLL